MHPSERRRKVQFTGPRPCGLFDLPPRFWGSSNFCMSMLRIQLGKIVQQVRRVTG